MQAFHTPEQHWAHLLVDDCLMDCDSSPDVRAVAAIPGYSTGHEAPSFAVFAKMVQYSIAKGTLQTVLGCCIHCQLQSETALSEGKGCLCCRRELLEGLGFEFDEAKAEWMRWYAELATSTDEAMLGSGLSRDFYLYNW